MPTRWFTNRTVATKVLVAVLLAAAVAVAVTALAITRLGGTGLPVPSVIRTAKFATIEAGDATPLGQVPAALLRRVQRLIATESGL